MKTALTTDHCEILSMLERDRHFSAYAIGDLEPGLDQYCTWAMAEDQGQTTALVLHYRSLHLSALFLMGDSAGLRAILEERLRPERVYITCLEERMATTSHLYAWEEVEPMWRMVLRPQRFLTTEPACTRLTLDDLAALQVLYSHGGADAFAPSQLKQGVFYGVWQEGQLLAAAGTHLVSPTYRVAAVGNVFTRPDWRGRGLGTATTSAVAAELLRQGIHDIVLNVSRDNIIAGGIYEKLGFERHCPFVEGRAVAYAAI